MKQKFQVHIGGSQRSGKTTLAYKLAEVMSNRGYLPVVIDIDATRVGIFGPDIPYDSPFFVPDLEQKQQGYTYKAAYMRVADVLDAGGVPIMTATHSRSESYAQAAAIATAHHALLRFILLEPVSLEEFLRRARTDTNSASNMSGELEGNLHAQRVFLETTERFVSSYQEVYCHKSHLWVRQRGPEEMARRALRYVLKGK